MHNKTLPKQNPIPSRNIGAKTPTMELKSILNFFPHKKLSIGFSGMSHGLSYFWNYTDPQNEFSLIIDIFGELSLIHSEASQPYTSPLGDH